MRALQQHVHRDLIVAWAGGAAIQYNVGCGWCDCKQPAWRTGTEYRIKPEPVVSLDGIVLTENEAAMLYALLNIPAAMITAVESSGIPQGMPQLGLQYGQAAQLALYDKLANVIRDQLGLPPV